MPVSGKRAVPPPLLYIGAFLAGTAMAWVRPLPLFASTLQTAAGVAMTTVAGVLVGAVLLRFHRERTTFDPGKTATTLVVDGPFRFSRHPSYVALTLVYLGCGLLLDNAWVLILALPVLLAMDRVVMPREEKRLLAVFGEEYAHYMTRVRRWL